MSEELTFHFTKPTPLTPLTMRAMKWEGQDEVLRYLEEHGVAVEDNRYYYMLTFPDGTLESRRLPVVWGDYTRLTLPDGTIVDTVYIRDAVAIGVDCASIGGVQEAVLTSIRSPNI